MRAGDAPFARNCPPPPPSQQKSLRKWFLLRNEEEELHVTCEDSSSFHVKLLLSEMCEIINYIFYFPQVKTGFFKKMSSCHGEMKNEIHHTCARVCRLKDTHRARVRDAGKTLNSLFLTNLHFKPFAMHIFPFRFPNSELRVKPVRLQHGARAPCQRYEGACTLTSPENSALLF